MVGITSYGAYVPMLRLPLAAITGGKPGGPEKAVANWDEDAVTMAMAAAIDCLRGIDRASIDGVLFDAGAVRSEEHTSELQSRLHLVCRLLLEKKKNRK